MDGTALVTGATRGLGKAVATRLARNGQSIVIVARDKDSGAAAAAEIRERTGQRRVGLLVGDLSCIGDVRRVAEEAKSKYPDLTVLVNNAGVSKFARNLTRDGLETTFATNYLAPFLLSNLLLEVLTLNRPSKIINISSEQHRFVRTIPWQDLQGEHRYQPIEQYNLTKLYDILLSREMARRTRDAGVVVNSVSPGFLHTDLGREARGAFRVFLTLARPFQRSAAHGAGAVVHVLNVPVSGAYFRNKKETLPSELAQDDASAARLWEVSCGFAGLEAGELNTQQLG